MIYCATITKINATRNFKTSTCFEIRYIFCKYGNMRFTSSLILTNYMALLLQNGPALVASLRACAKSTWFQYCTQTKIKCYIKQRQSMQTHVSLRYRDLVSIALFFRLLRRNWLESDLHHVWSVYNCFVSFLIHCAGFAHRAGKIL